MNIPKTCRVNKDALARQTLLNVYTQRYPSSEISPETATKEDIRQVLLDYIQNKAVYRRELKSTAIRINLHPQNTLISKIDQSFLGGYDYFPEYEMFYQLVRQKIPYAGFTADVSKSCVL